MQSFETMLLGSDTPVGFSTGVDLDASVRAALNQLGRSWTQGICITFTGATVRLEGTVRSYFRKQQCQHAAGQIPGVQQVLNEIAVIGIARTDDY